MKSHYWNYRSEWPIKTHKRKDSRKKHFKENNFGLSDSNTRPRLKVLFLIAACQSTVAFVFQKRDMLQMLFSEARGSERNCRPGARQFAEESVFV